MITKAYIEEIIDAYHYRVRMPIFDQIKSSSTATPKAMLPIATVCGMAGTFYNFKVDDVVYVAVENGERDNIVILGSFLYDGSETTPPDVAFSHLTVNKSLKLGNLEILSGNDSERGKRAFSAPTKVFEAGVIPPVDTNLFWVDTAHGNALKFYDGTTWQSVSIEVNN